MRAAFVAALFVGLARAACADPAAPGFADGGAVTLARVIDGDTIALSDGRTVRLIGIDDLAGAARLAKALAGKSLTLRFAETRTDRAGRTLAALYADGRWVEYALVERGLARVRGTADNRAGLAELLAAEAAARQARRGLWREKRNAVRDAADVAKDGGTWQIVEGTVAHVGFAEGAVFVDFGARGADGALTLRIDRDALRLCRDAGLDPRKLEGARLRVRGFIDGTRRPVMDVAFPEEIELVAKEEPSPAAAGEGSASK
jgi:micrococcal nuclease